MTALRLKDLTKHFGVTVACDHITLEVPSGEILGILGPSGCGKTTMLRCLAGFEPLTAGEIWLEEKLVSSASRNTPPERRDIGMVFQSYALWPHLTVGENVTMPLRLHGTPAHDRAAMVADILERLGLAGLTKRYPSELSGGQQQRVALARATVIRPRLLLLDEPLSNLDAQLRNRLRDELREDLKKVGITTVFVTHDQAEAMVICDRVALLSAGKLVEAGSPRALYESPTSLFTATFLGHANVFPGTIVERANGRTVVAAAGARFDAVAERELPVGSKVNVLIRPEHLSVGDGAGGENRLRGRLRHSLFLGSRVDWIVDVGDVPLRVELSGGAPDVAPGTEVALSVPRARTLLFPA